MQYALKHISLTFWVAILLAGIAPLGFAATPDSSAVEQILQLAAADSCPARCEQNKKDCFARYTFTDSFGVKGVTVEGTRICWTAFHECMKQCK
jgi:hypothetical protein